MSIPSIMGTQDIRKAYQIRREEEMVDKAKKPDIIKVVDGRLVIDVALTTGKASASGKSKVYYSTLGNIELEGGYRLGVNLYRSTRG